MRLICRVGTTPCGRWSGHVPVHQSIVRRRDAETLCCLQELGGRERGVLEQRPQFLFYSKTFTFGEFKEINDDRKTLLPRRPMDA
jgi:hypothetical protein